MGDGDAGSQPEADTSPSEDTTTKPDTESDSADATVIADSTLDDAPDATDAGTDSADVTVVADSTADTASDAGSEVAQDTADAFDSLDATNASDSADTLDAPAACSEAGTQTRPCGKCGTQTRACGSDGATGWGACIGEGLCSPGETTSSWAGCGSMLERHNLECDNRCTWQPKTACALPKGWSSIAEAPGQSGARSFASTLWTGTEMLVWGGEGLDASGNHVSLFDGQRYRPAIDSWIPVAAPSGALGIRGSSLIAIGDSRVLVIAPGDGGSTLSTAALYDIASNSWTYLPIMPVSVTSSVGVWMSSTKRFWVFDVSGTLELDPAAPAWTTAPPAATSGRIVGAIETGSHVTIVYRDNSSGFAKTLATVFDPATKTFGTAQAAPTSARMGVQGSATADGWFEFSGFDSVGFQSDGALLRSGAWRAVTPPGPTTLAPIQRYNPAIWCNVSACWVWGGYAPTAIYLAGGAMYDFAADAWTAMPTAGQPAGRYLAASVWTGTYAIVSGGSIGAQPLRDGAIFVP